MNPAKKEREVNCHTLNYYVIWTLEGHSGSEKVCVYFCVPVCVSVCWCDENVVYQDMADRLLNAPLMKFTINKKVVITSFSK